MTLVNHLCEKMQTDQSCSQPLLSPKCGRVETYHRTVLGEGGLPKREPTEYAGHSYKPPVTEKFTEQTPNPSPISSHSAILLKALDVLPSSPPCMCTRAHTRFVCSPGAPSTLFGGLLLSQADGSGLAHTVCGQWAELVLTVSRPARKGHKVRIRVRTSGALK